MCVLQRLILTLTDSELTATYVHVYTNMHTCMHTHYSTSLDPHHTVRVCYVLHMHMLLDCLDHKLAIVCTI